MRPLTDIDELTAWRSEVLAAVFGTAPSEQLMEANRSSFLRHLADGTLYGTVAEVGGEDAGCGIAFFREELPSPDNPSGLCALLMNIYVRPAFRRRGTGGEIVRTLVDEALRRGCGRISLETTPQARQLYRSAGFLENGDVMEFFCRC